MRHLIKTQQLTIDDIERIFYLTQWFIDRKQHSKDLTKSFVGNLSCSLYFTQPSTRTFTSFSFAAQALGMNVEEIRDEDMSSLYKGESELDTLKTLAKLSDLVVLRQKNQSLAQEFMEQCGDLTRIINAGSGADQHPTQALLDLYMIDKYFDVVNHKNEISVMMVGDMQRSRTARSLSYLLSKFQHVRQIFVSPKRIIYWTRYSRSSSRKKYIIWNIGII